MTWRMAGDKREEDDKNLNDAEERTFKESYLKRQKESFVRKVHLKIFWQGTATTARDEVKKDNEAKNLIDVDEIKFENPIWSLSLNIRDGKFKKRKYLQHLKLK